MDMNRHDVLPGRLAIASKCGCSGWWALPHPTPRQSHHPPLASVPQMEAFAVNGPTEGHDLPPFDWREFKGQGLPHAGMPQRFQHRFEAMAVGSMQELEERCLHATAAM